jgi:hypothetical protein
MMRIDAPAQAIAVVGSCTIGDEGRAMATISFYRPEAAEVAAAEQPKWTSWLRGLLEGERIAN